MEHCRDQSLAEGEALIGTAPTHERYLLLEARFPWAHDILETKDITAFRAVLQSYTVKTLLLGSDAVYSRKGYRQVILAEKEGMRFVLREFLVPEGKETMVLPQILEGKGEAYSTREVHRHILVCIDGGHDYCCGRWGQPCYDALRADFTEQEVRIWRVSHIGGHRFAPTAIDFPEGRYYGRLDENASTLFRKTRAFEPSMYRGNGCLPKELQTVEGEILGKEGWEADLSRFT